MRTVLVTAFAAVLLAGGLNPGWTQSGRAPADDGTWTVTACDKRKSVVVEGVRPDQPLPPAKARQVAALLQHLMRFCDEEVKARLTVRERSS